jgi:MFS family permease
MTAHQATSTSASPPQANRRWLSVSALSAAYLVDSSESQALSVLWPQMYRALGVSVGQLGAILAISQLISTLTLPFWGYAVDRFSRKWLLVCFTGFWGLWTCAIGFIDTVPELMVMRALSALGLGVFLPAAFSLIGDLFTSQSRGRAIGTMRAVGTMGTLIAFGGLPVFAARSPEAWRLAFMGVGILSFLSGLLMLLLQEPVRGAAEPELRGITSGESVWRDRFTWHDLRTIARIKNRR